jgi:hypothetical protein
MRSDGPPFRILITGSREWPDPQIVLKALAPYMGQQATDTGVVVVTGACPTGADAMALMWAQSWARQGVRVEVEQHPADWSLGKKAGPLRNQAMVDLGADVCIAFPMPRSRGTLDCVRRAEKAGIPVHWISSMVTT